MIPCLTSAGDGVWWSGHGGQRRRCYKAGGGGARGAKEELGRRRWLLVVDVVLGDAPRPLLKAAKAVEGVRAGRRPARRL